MTTWKYSGVEYDSPTASQVDFNLTTSGGDNIPYLSGDHIEVYTSSDSGKTWTKIARGSESTEWDFKVGDPKVVTFNTAPGTAKDVRLIRNTPYKTKFTTFQEGSLLTNDQLNDGEDFSMYVDQELYDKTLQIKDDDGNVNGDSVIDTADQKAQTTSWTDNDDKVATAGALAFRHDNVIGDGTSYPGAGNKGQRGKLRIDNSTTPTKTFWWDESLSTPAWVEITSHKGTVTEVKGGDGIAVTSANTTPEVSVDLDTVDAEVGLQFDNDKLQLKPASTTARGGIRIGTTLTLSSTDVLDVAANVTGGVTFKGTVDLRAAPGEPTSPEIKRGDLYINNNGTSGAPTSGWADLIEGVSTSDTVDAGDIIIAKKDSGGDGTSLGTDGWSYIPVGAQTHWETNAQSGGPLAGTVLRPKVDTNHVWMQATAGVGGTQTDPNIDLNSDGHGEFKKVTADQRTVGTGTALVVIGKGKTTSAPPFQILNGESGGTIFTAKGVSNAEVITFNNTGGATFGNSGSSNDVDVKSSKVTATVRATDGASGQAFLMTKTDHPVILRPNNTNALQAHGTGRLEALLTQTGSIPTNGSLDTNSHLTLNNRSDTAKYTGLAFVTRQTTNSQWLIANEHKANNKGDLIFRAKTGTGTGSVENVRFENDGKITTGNSSQRGQFRGTCPDSITASSADAFVATYDGSIVFDVKYSGDATFAGDVEIGDDPTSNVNTEGVMIRSGGRIIARSANANDAVWTGCVDGTNDTSIIKASGAAEFVGQVLVNRSASTDSAFQASDGNTSQPHFRVTGGGKLTIGENVSDGTKTSIELTQNGAAKFASRTIQLNANGTASFTADSSSSPAFKIEQKNDTNILELEHKGTDRISVTNGGKIILHASGKPAGIQFGSTDQGGSISSQTLNDYEEGTWTPNFAGGTKDLSFANPTKGNYTKIGRQVTLAFVINLDGSSAANGTNYVLTGFPFKVSNTLDEGSAGGGAFTRSTLIEAGNPIQLIALKNQSRASCTINGNGVANDADGTSLDGANILGYVTYFTDD